MQNFYFEKLEAIEGDSDRCNGNERCQVHRVRVTLVKNFIFIHVTFRLLLQQQQQQ
jgi:hypothetical protein